LLKVLSVVAVVASITSIVLGLVLVRVQAPERKRIVLSMHISSGIALSVTSALLAFWAFTQ